MKKQDGSSRPSTRTAILEALAEVIVESGGVGFSVQAVADRAGVTHRTVYNHFPTRDALCEAFSDYVDASLAEVGEPIDPLLTREKLPEAPGQLYRTLQLRERNVRAGVMLMIANRHPTTTWRERSAALEQIVATNPRADAPSPRLVAAAMRLFLSSIGWHLLTEQCGLTTEEAAEAGTWASRVLLDAAVSVPSAQPSSHPAKAKNANRRRTR